MTYRFLGSLTRVFGAAPLTLNQFGQQFELTADQAADIRHYKGIAAIPEEDFVAIFPEGKVDAKAPDFAEKKMRAFTVLDALRQEQEVK